MSDRPPRPVPSRASRSAAVALLALLLLAPAVRSQASAQRAPAEATPRESAGTPPKPEISVTHHTLALDGGSLAYRAVTGETYILDDGGAPEASIFTVGYFLDGEDAAQNPANRPIAFFFNGGPGSTATWLHLGAFGPERLVLEDAIKPGSPPYELAPNPYTLLPATDMVFVDPIGTGFSHALGEHQDSEYWGVDQDSASLARFIRTYLTEHKRWASPKYLVGESYGTIRSALLVRDLQLDVLDNTTLNGVVLLSSALDVRAFIDDPPGNDLIYVATLPTFAAVARYHHRNPDAPADLDDLLDAARDFAAHGYLTALFQGDALPDDERNAVAAELARLTGLSEDFILRSNLRVSVARFTKELLRDEGKVLAQHDGRYVGRDPDEAGENVAWDPFLLSIAGPFSAVMNDYLADELGVTVERRYDMFNLQIPQVWKRSQDDGWTAGFLNVVPYLAAAAAGDDDFHVFVGTGIHDLVTSFYGIEHTFAHSDIPKDQITLRNYFGGHMMYLHDPSLAKLSADIRQMIDGR